MSFGFYNDTVPRNVSKTTAQNFSGHFTKSSGDCFRGGQEDQFSSPSTPSLTISSSHLSCESCENSGQQCHCRDENYPGRGRRHYEMTDISRNVSPAESIRCRQDSSALHNFLQHRLPPGCSTPPPKGNAYPTPDATDSPGTSHEYDCRSEKSPTTTQAKGDAGPTNSTQAVSQDIVLTDYPDSDPDRSEGEDEDEYDEEDDTEDGKDEWSGQDDNIEAMVLEAFSGDLQLAAQMIPIFHGIFYSGIQASVREKVGPWRNGITTWAGTTGTGGGSGNAPAAREVPNQTPTNPRKRARVSGSSNHETRDGEEEEEEEEENRDPKDTGDSNETGQPSQNPNLACPFHKLDPAKYSIQHDTEETAKNAKYRACEGPGFKSIQRLKEHLKRKHYPVQCDRCYKIFPGSDRASCVQELQTHRQLLTPCQLGSESLKEGISDAQWANLDKKNNAKKPQAISRIEKYWQIWDTIFPGVTKPATPWYDEQAKTIRRSREQFSQQTRMFTDLFAPILELQVRQQHIVYSERAEEEEMRRRTVLAAERAFTLYASLYWSSPSNSSSSRSMPQSSHLGSSYQFVSSPHSFFSRHSSSGSHGTIAQTPAYPMDNQGSLSHRPSMAPPPSNLQQMNPQGYVTNMPIHGQRPQIPGYTVNFPENGYNGNNPVGNGGLWYGSYNAAGSSYNPSPSTDQLSTVGFPMDDTLIDSSAAEGQELTDLSDWPPLTDAGDPTQMRFDRRQL